MHVLKIEKLKLAPAKKIGERRKKEEIFAYQFNCRWSQLENRIVTKEKPCTMYHAM